MASGDTAYVVGTFREVVTVGITSPVAETQILGDPTNAQGFKTSGGVLLTPAEVVWTAYTTNDTTAPAASATVTLNGRDFLTFQTLTIIGGNANPSCVNGNTTNSVTITFRACKMIVSSTSGGAVAYTGLADVAATWTIDRCHMISYAGSGVAVILPTSTVADYDAVFLIQNTEIITLSAGLCATVAASGANSFKGGGVRLLNCSLISRASGFGTSSAALSTSIPCTINNSFIISGSGPALSANASGQITEDYCRIVSASPRTNVSAGAHSIADMSHAPLFDLGYAQHLGFIPRPYWGPMANSPLLGFGSTGAPSVDILNRPRPAGGQSIANAVGAYERHDSARAGSSLGADAGGYIEIVGPGDHDFQVPVDATLTTLTIKVKWDATHADTNKPQVILQTNGALGVATETKTATGTAGSAYETLTFSSFTPTAKGVVVLRCVSRAAAGGGIAAFDTATGGATGSQGFDYSKRGEPFDAVVAGGSSSGGLIGGASLTGGVQ